MNKFLILALGGALSVALSQAQTAANSQATSSGSQDTSVSAGQSGAQADSKTAVSAQQQSKVAENSPAGGGQLASGSMIYVELSKSIDAKKAKQGDEVTAKTEQAVLSQGKVLIPKGAKLIGHVTAAKPHEKDRPQSELGIAFDHAVLKDGTQIPLGSVAIQAIAPPPASSPAMTGGADTMGGASPGMPSSNSGGMGYPSGSGRGNSTVGQVGSTVGGVANTAGDVAGSTSTTATAGTRLSGNSKGVVGMSGLSLSAGSSTQGSVVASDNKNVRLESGTEMVLRVQ